MAFYHGFCVLSAIILTVGSGVYSSECTQEMFASCMKDMPKANQKNVDAQDMCKKSKAALACLEGLVKDCKGQVKTQAEQTLATMKPNIMGMCGGGSGGNKCDIGKIQSQCPQAVPKNDEEACKLLPKLKKCYAEFKECKGSIFDGVVNAMKSTIDQFKDKCTENHGTSVIGSSQIIFTAAFALLLSHFYF